MRKESIYTTIRIYKSDWEKINKARKFSDKDFADTMSRILKKYEEVKDHGNDKRGKAVLEGSG